MNSITINGIVIDNLFVNENQDNSISTGMIVDGTITISDLGADSVGASELIAIYESGSAFDTRFINTNGDTMTGNLNLGNNQILGVSTLNTSNGAYELFAMNQNVLTTSNPTFNNINSNGILYVNEIRPKSGSSVTIRLN